jgi:hypothetical protein
MAGREVNAALKRVFNAETVQEQRRWGALAWEMERLEDAAAAAADERRGQSSCNMTERCQCKRSTCGAM